MHESTHLQGSIKGSNQGSNEGSKPEHLGLLLLGLLLFLPHFAQNAKAQNQETQGRFRAFPVLGYNASQIDGDNIAGFYKAGLSAGVGVYSMLDERQRFSLSLEILYDQKGSRSRPGIKPLDRVSLDYVTVPLQFNYHDQDRMIFGAGISFASLFRANVLVNDTLRPDISENFEPREIGYLFTATIIAAERIGIGLRYSGSITSFGDSVNPAVRGLINRTVGLRASYIF